MAGLVILLVSCILVCSVAGGSAPSCRDRCWTRYDIKASCQCNQKCSLYKNCCSDYSQMCVQLAGVDIHIPELMPTDSELIRLGNQLWGRDVNRGTRSDVVIDVTGNRLFSYVNPSLLRRVTYSRLRTLLENYEPEIGVPEPPCSSCRADEDAFLDAIMDTTVMQHAWGFLVNHGLADSNRNGFRNELRQYWFMRYSRSRGIAMDSGGFEHVFVGEVRGGSVTGFHNWVQFYESESGGQLQYTAFNDQCQPDLLNVSFNWLGRRKPVSSMFYGVSPEFEMALYTVCFQSRQTSNCNLQLNGQPTQIRSFSMSGVSPRTVGSAYPSC